MRQEYHSKKIEMNEDANLILTENIFESVEVDFN